MSNMLNKLKQLFYKLNDKWKRRDSINSLLLGKLNIDRILKLDIVDDLSKVEFQVFSQFGEDGIIQYLINNIEIPYKIFIEFGVENYLESNTRFLLLNDCWSGLVIDGSPNKTKFIKKDELAYYRSDLRVINKFITKDNINELIASYTNEKDIGILSIDIDGNDYWVLQAIEKVKPRILICEYNGFFGSAFKITVPYKDNFIRKNEHKSHVYFGASLAALVDLAHQKGYDFVGCGAQGVNAFFVRKDLNHPFKKFDLKTGYRKPLHKEFRNSKNEILPTTENEVLYAIKDMMVYDIDKKTNVYIKDLYGY
ncbi:MAG: FkbM family methyltransferase [Bacteroidetes bacterium]|nr:FkbM family methyltransferase [Bacteroidota bacterium]